MLKKIIYTIILSAILISCNEDKSYIDSTKLCSVKLKNNLGTIIIRIPRVLDTLKENIHFSDISSADRYNFNFISKNDLKNYPDTTQEFGPFPSIDNDVDIASFTISQCLHLNRDTISKNIYNNFLDIFLQNVKAAANPKSKILGSETFTNNIGKGYLIKYSYITNKKTSINIRAVISIKNELVSLNFSQFSSQDTTLAEIMKKCIKNLIIK
jgi:hypothetical protein